MTHPPRAVESILKGIGADPYLSDVVLGDMAEEFDQRVAFDGEADARRWYASEALRCVPHLLRSAFRRLRFGDIPRLIVNSLYAWLALVPVGLVAYIVVAGVLRLLGIDWSGVPTQSAGFAALAVVTLPAGGFVGGFVAAWRNGRAPLIGAVAFGVVMTSINVITGLFYPSPISVGYRVACLAMFNAAAIIGGVVRVVRLKPSAGSALSTS